MAYRTPRNHGTTRSPSEKVARPYQNELLNIALTDNTIIALGTGCGKTHIACMLINEMKETGRLSRGLKVLFLAPTDALVKQQSDVIYESTPLSVQFYMGGIGVSEWNLERWEEELKTVEVMVMVAQTALNAINSGVLPVSRIGLLIFDECHHARKKHPYREIMRTLETNVEKLMCDFPKILGLSASIVTRNLKDLDKLEKEIGELEAILHSKAVTATDSGSMSIHATNPTEKSLFYDEFEMTKFKSTLHRVEEMKSFLDFIVTKENIRYPGWEFSAKNAVDACRFCISDCIYALKELGVGPAIRCIQLCVEGLRKYRINIPGGQYKHSVRLSELELHFFCNTVCVLEKFGKDLRKFDSRDDCYSDKVNKLCEIIKSFIETKHTDSIHSKDATYRRSTPLCGIVFTHRRISAVLLEGVFGELECQGFPYSQVKCGHVVGHGATATISIGEMNIRQQEAVLDDFRSQKLNLLTATNVLEEGLDVPQCNLIVRFDLPNTPRSYIQSKGRARNKEALLYHMILRKEMGEHLENLNTFQRIERMLTSTCSSRSGDSYERPKDLEDILPHTIPRTGAKLTGQSAVMLLNSYCQRFYRDPYSVPRPYVESDKIKSGNPSAFLCRLLLPERSPFREVMESDVWPTDELARREVHLKTCVKLHEIGEIDDYLQINKRTEKDLPTFGPDLSGLTLPNSKNSYYENKIPSALSKPLDLRYDGSTVHFIYRFVIEHRLSGFPYWGQADDEVYLEDPNNYVGIITAESLPYSQIPTFEVYYHDLNLKVGLELITTRTPPNKILSQLAKFQDSVFIEIIRSNMDIFKYTPNESTRRSFMICPLIDLEPGKWDFDLDCLAAYKSTPVLTSEYEEFYLNRVVTSNFHEPKRYFHVIKISKHTTLRSKFPDPTYPTYADYYNIKRGISFGNEDFNRKALEVVYVSGHINLITSRHKTAQGKDLPKRDYSRHQNLNLFSPHLTAHPIPSTLWRLCVILPSILWRLESFLLMLELAASVDDISPDTGSGVMDTGAAHGHLNYETQAETETCADLRSCGRSPDLISLLTGFTAASAGDLINLERQEFLGDSFLKLISSVFFFSRFAKMNEGDLTTLRFKFVANDTLHALGVKKGIVNMVRTVVFDVRAHYIPPRYSFKRHVLEESIKIIPPGQDKLTSDQGFCMLSEKRGNVLKNNDYTGDQFPFCFQQFNDKMTADCIEAVLCAYVQTGGIQQGIRFLSYLDTGLEFNSLLTGSTPSQHYEEMGHFFSPTNAFSPYFEEYQSMNYYLKYSADEVAHEVSNIPHGKLEDIKLFQKNLTYQFENILLLVEAFTHSSFMSKITPSKKARPSYQRLEFLGDALLDYFTCVYMYQKHKDFLPDQLSQLRSAVVNNKRLSTLSLKCRFYQCILCNEKLTSVISQSFDIYQKEMRSDQLSSNDYCRFEYPKPLADVVEAVIAAVFVDSKFSLDTTWNVFGPIFKPIIDELAVKIPKNPINRLYELFTHEEIRMQIIRLGNQDYECTIHTKDRTYTEYGVSQDLARYKCAEEVVRKIAGDLISK